MSRTTDLKNLVDGLNKPLLIDMILNDAIIDVSIAGKRCIVNRMPEQKGGYLWFFTKHGIVKFNPLG